MDGVESMTRGWWRPTPGSIYPLLKEMTEQGILKKLDGGRYELTQKGRAQMQGPFGPPHRPPRTMDDMLSQMHSFVSYMEDVKSTDRRQLEPHRDMLKGLAKRISGLLAEGGGEEEKP